MYPLLFPENSILCPTCGSATEHSYWNDVSSTTAQPRLLHDMHNVVLLVSATYVCQNNHRLLAHDESILKLLPDQRMTPFVLLHKAGFTSNFVDTCTALGTHGSNFYNIETFVIERRWES